MLTEYERNSTRYLLYLDSRALPIEREAELNAALDQGYRVVMATTTPEAYRGYPLAHLITAPLGDYDAAEVAIIDYLAKHELTVHGIVAWKDLEVELVARLGARLGLPSSSLDAAMNVRDKVRTRALLDGIDGVNPRYALVRNEAELLIAVSEVGTPCLLKPAGNSGSRGIHRISESAEASAVFQEYRAYNRGQSGEMFHYYEDVVLLEQELIGSEHSVGGVVSNGRIITLAIADKLFDRSIPLQYQNSVPSMLPADTRRRMVEVAKAAVAATGINHCGFHVDMMVTADGVKVLEVGGRLGGELINSHLVPLAQPGLDPYRAVLAAVQGTTALSRDDYTESYSGSAASRVVMPPALGVLDRIDGVEDVRRDPRCRDFMQLYGPGDEMVTAAVRFKGFEIGYIVARCGPEEDMSAAMTELAGRVRITVLPTADASDLSGENA